jgi:predicted membrane-bound spermidine synthase
MSVKPGSGSTDSGELSRSAASRAALALYIIVLVSGAVLMGVEIGGSKVLAPGFGTSTYVWGSIIGMFMAALATGYYLGGVLSDKKPSFTILAGIVTAAGVWTSIIIPRFGPDISEKIARSDLGPVAGPLLATFAIFYIPSFLMGMVSPYAVKLNASSLAALGGVAGRLYALSTFGSIVGTLLTTFVLIPVFFLSKVMMFLGLCLIVAAVVSLILFRSAAGAITEGDRTTIGVMALLALICGELWAVAPIEPYMYPGQRLMHYRDSAYHEILVTEDVIQVEREGGMLLPVKLWSSSNQQVREVRRWLKFNENIESGIYPYRNEHWNAVNYTDLLHLPLMWVNDPKKILVVGAGGGVIPTQYHNWYGTQVDVCEIDPAVRDVAMKYFQVPETPDIKFHIGDGRQTIKRLDDKSYDIIFLDAYSSGGQIPFHLLTWEFLENVKSKLTDRGILVTNIISGIRNVTKQDVPPAALFLSEYKTLQASAATVKNNPALSNEPLFSQLYVFPKVYEGRPLTGDNYEEYRNVILIATREKERRSMDQMSDEIKALTNPEQPKIKAQKMLWHVEHLYTQGPKKEELDAPSVPILSDDYAPVDTMYRPVKRDESTRRLWL